MIKVTITIDELESGEVKVDMVIPPTLATEAETHFVERISKGVTEAMLTSPKMVLMNKEPHNRGN